MADVTPSPVLSKSHSVTWQLRHTFIIVVFVVTARGHYGIELPADGQINKWHIAPARYNGGEKQGMAHTPNSPFYYVLTS